MKEKKWEEAEAAKFEMEQLQRHDKAIRTKCEKAREKENKKASK